MDKDSQCKMILFYLKEQGPITAKIARQLCGCERLAARICDLRKKGIPIKTEINTYINKNGYKTRYGIYSLEETQCSTTS